MSLLLIVFEDIHNSIRSYAKDTGPLKFTLQGLYTVRQTAWHEQPHSRSGFRQRLCRRRELTCLRLRFSKKKKITSLCDSSKRTDLPGSCIKFTKSQFREPLTMASIFSIAPEVLHEITSWLLVPDQAALVRTCKRLHDQLTPVVWNEVELHHRGVHEGLIIWQLLDDCSLDQAWADRKVSEEYPFGDCAYRPSSRKYAQPERGRKAWLAYGKEVGARKRDSSGREPRAADNGNRQTYQYGRGKLFLGLKGGGGGGPLTCPPSRWAGLAAHVQSLCMSVAVDRDVWAVLADLVNLRSLQLVGPSARRGVGAAKQRPHRGRELPRRGPPPL